MRDHYFVDDRGTRTPVSQLSTEMIRHLLTFGIEVESMEPGETKQDAIDRLQLELFIREKGLRQ